MSTVLLIDDHAMFREGLLLALRAAAPELRIEALASGAEALALLPGRPDVRVVMMDYYLPVLGAGALIARLRAVRPDLRLLVISASEDPQDVQAALRAGANGFIPKSADSRALLDALQTVQRGERYLPPAWRNMALPSDETAIDGSAADKLAELTPRQRQVLKLVCEGLRNGEIAERLGMTEKTVKAHMSGIFAALDVLNRTQAATLARQGGLLGKPN